MLQKHAQHKVGGDKGGDRIDELIEDGEKALKGMPSTISQQTGPDPKALKDAFLETSPAFRETPHRPPCINHSMRRQSATIPPASKELTRLQQA